MKKFKFLDAVYYAIAARLCRFAENARVQKRRTFGTDKAQFTGILVNALAEL